MSVTELRIALPAWIDAEVGAERIYADDEARIDLAIRLARRNIEERTGAVRSITPSTLYSSIHRLLENGLIRELAERPAEDDERRRYYRLTPLGRGVAELEARRLERLLRAARSGGVLTKRT